MSTPQEPCRACRGTGLIATAGHDRNVFPYAVCPDCDVIHHEPRPACTAPTTTPATEAARSHERAGDAGRRLWETLHVALGVEGYLDDYWGCSWDNLPGGLQGELADAALRLGVAERHAHATRVSEPALVWTRSKPTASAYYWLRTVGYERGIVVWVFYGMHGDLFVDAPIVRYVAEQDGWWAGPLPEPAWPAESSTQG